MFNFEFLKKQSPRQSFTLIELLIVLAIVAILSVVVILTLNPAELLKQARDSNRLSDLSNLNNALNLFAGDVNGGFMGSSSVVYVSIPDASSTCSHLGLPTLPAGWSYVCANATSTRNTDGTGWIPVNFSLMSYGRPLSQLPLDPVNTTTTGNYFTYVAGGSWQISSKLESQKYQPKAISTNDYDPGLYVLGSNTNLAPFVGGLVGYWKFDEGSGSTTTDSSGWGNDGIANGTTIVAGKNGNARSFNGSSDYITVNQTLSVPITIAGWIKVTDFTKSLNNFINSYPHNTLGISLNRTGIGDTYVYIGNGSGWLEGKVSSINMVQSQWHYIVFTSSGNSSRLYLDTALVATSNYTPSGWGSYFHFGNIVQGGEYLKGQLDDTRIYNRALSASEILALYNATK